MWLDICVQLRWNRKGRCLVRSKSVRNKGDSGPNAILCVGGIIFLPGVDAPGACIRTLRRMLVVNVIFISCTLKSSISSNVASLPRNFGKFSFVVNLRWRGSLRGRGFQPSLLKWCSLVCEGFPPIVVLNRERAIIQGVFSVEKSAVFFFTSFLVLILVTFIWVIESALLPTI